MVRDFAVKLESPDLPDFEVSDDAPPADVLVSVADVDVDVVIAAVVVPVDGIIVTGARFPDGKI